MDLVKIVHKYMNEVLGKLTEDVFHAFPRLKKTVMILVGASLVLCLLLVSMYILCSVLDLIG